MPPAAALSSSIEEYLQAIHRLSQRPEGVSTTGLARELGVKPASVTGMLRKLADMRLITYRRYRNIRLTPSGDRRANGLLRRHRLTERLLTDMLQVPLDEAHKEACRLEHALSPELESRIAQRLGAPEACPHGHPLDVDADDETISLTQAPPNRALVIVRLEDESPEVVRYLSERGMLPGARLEVKLREPLDGALFLNLGGKTDALGSRLAATLRVRLARSGD